MIRLLPSLFMAAFAALGADPARAAFQLDLSTDELRPGASSATAPRALESTADGSGAECVRQYAVRPGDTLEGIARRELGDVRLVGALVDLNRDRLRDPDVLRSGQTLRMPCIGETSPTERIAAEAVQAVAATAPCDRRYAVQPGDTLGAIARRELGSARRIGELVELNRDSVRNPDILRTGQRLRLPCDDAPVATAAAPEPEPAPQPSPEPTPETATDPTPATAARAEPVGTETAAAAGEPVASEPEAPEASPEPESETATASVPDPAPENPPATESGAEVASVAENGDGTPEEGTEPEPVAEQPWDEMTWGRDSRWIANRGERLADVLTRWGHQAGYTVVVRAPWPWVMGLDYQRSGDFVETVNDLLEGFGTSNRAPSVRIFANNVLMLESR